MTETHVRSDPGLRPVIGARLVRSRDDRLLAGVAAGIAGHLGLHPTIVRIAFVLSAFAAGFGIIVYVLTWLLAPIEEVTEASTPRPPRRLSVGRLVGIGLVLAGLSVALGVAGLWFGGEQGWPVLLAAIGFAILWARRSDDGRAPMTLEAVMTGPISLPRFAIGVLLILGSMGVFVAANTSLAAAGSLVVAMVVAVVGAGLLAGPWVWNLGRQVVEERASRVRSEARAEMAAHLHDSVLQTLALIQRSGESREMTALARTQERELRSWLYGAAPTVAGTSLREAIEALADRAERQHRVRVEAVVVGDLELDERLRAIVEASSEAVANAALHAGVGDISLYVEVEPDAVSAFVRDQGGGFDPSAVPADRRGIADSIVGRIERRGGSVTITSRPGAGTEVVMRLPRVPA